MELRIEPGKKFEIKTGETIYETLKRNDTYLVASCGGKGVCGKCRVKVLNGKYNAISHVKLSVSERKSGIVLACLTVPESDLTIEIPNESKLIVGDKIAIARSKDLVEHLRSYHVPVYQMVKKVYLELPPPTIDDNISDLERLNRELHRLGLRDMLFSHDFVSTMSKTLREGNWKVILSYVKNGSTLEAIALQSPKKGIRRYGIAVDIGTTTVVVYLVDLGNGQVIDIGSTYNSQIRYGDDVITRIVYATEKEENLQELRNAVVSDINDIIRSIKQRHQIQEREIESAVIAGNTTMCHLFWGLDPQYIKEDPYIPAFNFYPLWWAGTARLEIEHQSPVYTLPSVGSYVGGDIVAGVLASKMHRNAEVSMLLDIGTNGEIAIGNNEWIVTAACSAGPCFEGSTIRNGMRATEGAIEGIEIDPTNGFHPNLQVIGSTEPVGICGSGMIDALSEMFLKGMITRKGRFKTDLDTDRIRSGEEGREYILHRGKNKDIVLTECDIGNLIRAKAAIYAGVSLLIKQVGLTLKDIQKVYISGGFGNYLDIKKAILMGMLPDMAEERFEYLGNTSVMGAYLCLLSDRLRKEAEAVASKMTYVELSVSSSFMEEYVSALFLPHTDLSRFPSVQKLLGQAVT